MALVYAGAGRPAIYVHAANLTTAGRVMNMELSRDAVDVSAFSDSAHRNLTTLQKATVRYDGLFNDADAIGTLNSHGAIKDLLGGTRRAMTVWPAGDGTGTLGVGFGSAYASSYKPVGSVGGFISLGADIAPDGTYHILTSLGSSTVAAIGSGATFNGPDVDMLASSTGGGVVYIHVFNNSGTGSVNVFLSDGTASGAVATSVGTIYTFPAGVTSSSTIYAIGSGTNVRRWRRYNVSLTAQGPNTVSVQVGLFTTG